MKTRTLILLACGAGLLAACGLGDTAVSAAAAGKGRAAEAEQARQTLDQVQQQLDAANAQAAAQRKALDEAAQ